MPRRPVPTEYADYYRPYIEKVPEGDVLDFMRQQLATITALVSAIPERKVGYRYAPGKWTTREVIGHVVDMEWVFTGRALYFARGDTHPLPGVDQELFLRAAHLERRPLADLGEEFGHLRSANLQLFASFDEATLDRTGTASDCLFTVRALLYVIAGHAAHHMGVLEERYLAG